VWKYAGGVPRFVDVALPIPLDRAFTYALGAVEACVGARVLVPFSGQRLLGIVVRVHDEAPASDDPSKPIEVKRVDAVLDEEALLSEELMELGRWIAVYYCAPLGEVLRGMVPLMAEVRRHFVYRMGERGRAVLYEGAAKGASRRSRLSVDDQNREYAVLNYLESGEAAKPAGIRAATGANKALLDAMARKKWLVREAVAETRDARRVEMVAVLEDREGLGIREQGLGSAVEAESSAATPTSLRDMGHPADEGSGVRAQGPEGGRRLPRLNENQLAVMAELAGCGGRELVRELRLRLARGGVPGSTLGTLVRRGLVRLEEVASAFSVSGLGNAGKKFAHEHRLNEAQTAALAAIVAAMGDGEGQGSRAKGQEGKKAKAGGFVPMLLYGVTGSGKTAVYIAAIQAALERGKSALLLVPEIGLTPGTAMHMVAAFGAEVALLHSQLTPDERAEQWHRIRRGEARVVIGTRSAVFSPLKDLGLILVDEEHDGSYKQEETPRYHGRDVAVMRAKILAERSGTGCVVVLGSATPSLESWHNAEVGKYVRIDMLERVMARPMPVVELVDMREEFRATGQEQIFSRQLLEETQATLDRGEQAIILLNRRGYSFVVMCRSCGEKLECENCAIALTYHKGSGAKAQYPEGEAASDGVAPPGSRLECHYCGYKRGVPTACPKCASEHLYFLGAGSQQGEEKLQELFPGARIGRMDRDTVRTRGDMERLLGRLHSGEINLLVGTQMIAKGHDIHGVTLVGVVGADFALGMPDFRSAERVFQLLTQVSGRAGRGELPGRVLVQTYQPGHYVHEYAQRHDYVGFAAREMYFRRGMRYPPVSVLANVLVQSDELQEVLGIAGRIGRWLEARTCEGVRVLGPAAAPIPRLKRIHRYHLLLKAEQRGRLSGLLKELIAWMEREEIPRRNVVVDVDAVHLM
jgi:primosomal protein N' (replication factor Y)